MNFWTKLVLLVPRGPEDFEERFARKYPEVWACAEQVHSLAGTYDADFKVSSAAGQIIADYSEWADRVRDAMVSRKYIAFDRLVTELDALRAQIKA